MRSLCLALLLLAHLGAQAIAAAALNPPIQREFRGVWIATVANIDWPSSNALTVADQKAELIRLLDRAAALRLNAVLFQVRPGCDALYESSLEPWSEFLTGTMGRAPFPRYDPLKLAVAEAHARGLELHAWFNPYRARHKSAASPVSPDHISRTKPALVKTYGRELWLDPGEPAVQEHSLNVVMDVVKRYDVDGIHFDDYFYPYRVTERGKEVDFPDQESWERIGSKSGLSRSDWRRDNVNRFVKRVYNSIKAAKPHVKFGVSPFGIWRPGYPPQIKGLDAYEQLYADSRKWIREGWLDYFAPQLYWPVDSPGQSFPALLKWWTAENQSKRHIWPGLNTYNTPIWKPGEIASQIRLCRDAPGADGHTHWNGTSILRNTEPARSLQNTLYAEPALVPEMPWLSKAKPPAPKLILGTSPRSARVSWSVKSNAVPVWLWVVQSGEAKTWRTEILPGSTTSHEWVGSLPKYAVVRAVNRFGGVSTPAVARLQRPEVKKR
jgi:uncharacterized lipoprotein YddW (UPF0748 family)